MLSDRTVAVFAVSNESYCPKAIVALLSVREHNPGCDLFLAGNITSQASIELLQRFGIRHLVIDYSDIFLQPPCTWPSEIWWPPMVASRLYELGYQVSVAIDGDIFAVRPFVTDIVPELLSQGYCIAGVENGPLSRYVRLGTWPPRLVDYVCHEYGMNSHLIENHQCTNSGVLWFNNALLFQENFSAKWVATYLDMKRIGGECGLPRLFRNDQEGYALLMPSIRFLFISQLYNFRFHHPAAVREAKDSVDVLKDHLKVVHFVHSKPWFRYKESDRIRFPEDIGKGRPRLCYIRDWQSFALKMFGSACDRLRVLELDKTHWNVRDQWRADHIALMKRKE